ncbi:MAG: DNA (cytosine-5-)-methyltransferase [Flavobacteriales bacterium]|nr:MAG: DNA (cytosine-5-)-methyltransferase [Flavobacteriales bacterium]
MIGIEIFSGPGGMGLGAKQAGIDVKLAIEKNKYAAQTYLTNHKETTVVIDDIENIKEFHFERNEEQVILFGGPPCQGYSVSNSKTRSSDNPKNWLFKQFMRAAKLIDPDWIVIENVPGLKKMDKGYFLKKICDDLLSLGYTPNAKVLNAADFGVPQKRERIFIIASKAGIAFDFPLGEYQNNHVTVSDAIFDLPKLENGDMEPSLKYSSKPLSQYAKMIRGKERKASQNFVSKNSDMVIERYSHIKQGNNWKDIPLELLSNYKDPTRCHSGIYRRLDQNKSSIVIANYRKSMLIHPTQNRGLSLREAARLQSFPDDYKFMGPLMHQQQQVGDAVPPLLAKAIFDKIQTYK